MTQRFTARRAAVAAVALVLAACSTTESEKEDAAPATTAAAATTAPAAEPEPATTAPAPVEDTAPPETAAPETTAVEAPAGEDGPGVTAETIKVGVIHYRDATAQELGGLQVPDQGDRKEQVTALAEAINADGGIAGRQIELVFRDYDTATDSPQTSEALCQGFTQDDKVFAVIMFAQYQTSTRSCYADADTLMIDQTLTPFTASELEKLAPYMWTPELPLYETVLAGQVASLVDSGWLTPAAKVGIMQKGDPMAKEAVATGYVPALESAGIETTVVDFDATDFTGASIQAAIGTMQGAGVTHVLFAGNPDTAAQFGAFAGMTGFTPQMAMTTFDLPGFFTDNAQFFPPGSLDFIVGMGFLPAADTRDPDFPATDGEKACIEPLTAAGITFDGRANARSAILLCDALFMIKAGADAVEGPLTAAAWAEAIVDSGWTAIGSLGTDLSRGPAPASVFRPIAFDPAVQRFVYSGPETPLP